MFSRLTLWVGGSLILLVFLSRSQDGHHSSEVPGKLQEGRKWASRSLSLPPHRLSLFLLSLPLSFSPYLFLLLPPSLSLFSSFIQEKIFRSFQQISLISLCLEPSYMLSSKPVTSHCLWGLDLLWSFPGSREGLSLLSLYLP